MVRAAQQATDGARQGAPSASRLRRERERAEMHDRLLATARSIAAEEGWQAVTIRKIADRLSYAPPILYQHFANKDALLLELMSFGFEEVAAQLAQVSDGKDGELVPAIGEVVWHFAFTSPELYQVMNGLSGAGFGTPSVPNAAMRVFMLVRDALLRDAAALARPVPDPDGAVDTVWAFIHGFVSLALAERISGGPERAHTLMTAALPAVFEATLGD